MPSVSHSPIARAGVVLLLWVMMPLYALARQQPEDAQPLFEADAPVTLVLETDLKALLRDRGEDPGYHDARLIYRTADGQDGVLPVRVQTRGNFRNDPKNCDFPPLRLNFKKEDVPGTLFHNQDKLKLVTHCQRKAANQENVYKEYLAYRIYHRITPVSFRVRLASLTYREAASDEGDTYPAFIIEDDERMAARNGAVLYDGPAVHQLVMDPHLVTTMAVFQYLIGNLDWSVWGRHNMEILVLSDRKTTAPVPYDFDFSGLVNAAYAEPPSQVDVPSVRERQYRGYCGNNDRLAAVLATFRAQEAAIKDLAATVGPLSQSEARRVRRFVDAFFDVIRSERRVEQAFMRMCRTIE